VAKAAALATPVAPRSSSSAASLRSAPCTASSSAEARPPDSISVRASTRRSSAGSSSAPTR
jgi:hypothetical protein